MKAELSKLGISQDCIDLIASLNGDVVEDRDTFSDTELVISFGDLFAHGDYTGSLVGKANRLCIDESKYRFPMERYGVESITGSHGYTDLRFVAKYWRRWYALLGETLAGLADYPVLDEEKLYEVEQEEKLEGWESWMRSDFLALFGDRASYDEHLYYMDVDSVTSDDAFTFADRILNDNGQWHQDGSSMWMDTEKGLNRAIKEHGIEVLWEGTKYETDYPLWGIAVSIARYHEWREETGLDPIVAVKGASQNLCLDLDFQDNAMYGNAMASLGMEWDLERAIA